MRQEVKGGEEQGMMLMRKKNNSNCRNNNGDDVFTSLLSSNDRDYLLSPAGNQVKVSDLRSKVVGLFFAANWYPPCRTFTPVLVGVYEQLRRQKRGFEIIFVSSDENSDAFEHYRVTMPWLAIPFSDLDTKRALNRRFDIEGIPCLVILQPNGNVVDKTLCDGVELIYRYGVRAFPFTEKRLKELEKEEKEKHENQTITNLLTSPDRDYLLAHSTTKQVTVASLVGKTVGLYFSAQWCLPCRKFTPKLISVYHKIRQMFIDGMDSNFEIVFVSSDHNQGAFASYFDTMPWLALPFGDSSIKSLMKYFDVQGIPCLVIIGTDGKTLTKEGRSLVNLYREKAYPFTKTQLKALEKQMDEEAKSLPRYKSHAKHRHELTLVSEGTGGGPFICCDCEEQGSSWAYQCLECGYEVHPKCVESVNIGTELIEPFKLNDG